MEEDQIVHKISTGNDQPGFLTKNTIIIFLLLISAGVLTGFLVARIKGPILSQDKETTTASISRDKIFGIKDKKTFKDETEGILRSGGIDGEGAYHLERPGGVSQYVYLTSSTIDLSKFLNRKVKVWGQTNKGKKAGWLMDVGRLQVLE